MSEELSIKVVNQSNNSLPFYATDGAAGADVCAFLHEEIVLLPGRRSLIPTGLFVEIPQGFEIQIRPRSGFALKHGVTCLNTPGTIDSDYRGEIKVLLINLGEEEVVIKTGERIAQLVVNKIETAVFVSVNSIDETTRSAGGFGHTGK